MPWICDALLSNHSVKAYGRDLMDFLRHMEAQGVTPLSVTADHVKLYKRALFEAGLKSATVARKVYCHPPGVYKELAAKGLLALGDGPGYRCGEGRRRPEELDAVLDPAAGNFAPGGDSDRDLPRDKRDLALMSVFFITGCRVSAIIHACVGHLETDRVEHYLHVTEKRGKRRRKILLDAAPTGPGLRLTHGYWGG